MKWYSEKRGALDGYGPEPPPVTAGRGLLSLESPGYVLLAIYITSPSEGGDRTVAANDFAGPTRYPPHFSTVHKSLHSIFDLCLNHVDLTVSQNISIDMLKLF